MISWKRSGCGSVQKAPAYHIRRRDGRISPPISTGRTLLGVGGHFAQLPPSMGGVKALQGYLTTDHSFGLASLSN